MSSRQFQAGKSAAPSAALVGGGQGEAGGGDAAGGRKCVRDCASGGNVAFAAFFGWRRKAIRSGVVKPRADADRLGFVEVSAASTSMVEICLGDIVIRTGADVDFDHLLKVIRVVRQA
jgi:hypothetical protein